MNKKQTTAQHTHMEIMLYALTSPYFFDPLHRTAPHAYATMQIQYHFSIYTFFYDVIMAIMMRHLYFVDSLLHCAPHECYTSVANKDCDFIHFFITIFIRILRACIWFCTRSYTCYLPFIWLHQFGKMVNCRHFVFLFSALGKFLTNFGDQICVF